MKDTLIVAKFTAIEMMKKKLLNNNGNITNWYNNWI